MQLAGRGADPAFVDDRLEHLQSRKIHRSLSEMEAFAIFHFSESSCQSRMMLFDRTEAPLRTFSPLRLATAGMLTLAAAIGIGRFAFTPVLPMMQKDLGLSLQAAGWLASANYAGYFVGALSAVWLRGAPRTIVRGALIATAVLTAGMGLTSNIYAWLCLRALAGVVSAWALVFSSAWVLRVLAASGNSRLGGVVFGGVGLGAALAGVLCLAFLGLGRSADQAWIALSLLALVAAAVVWPVYRDATEPTAAPARAFRIGTFRDAVARERPADRLLWLLRVRLHHSRDLHPGARTGGGPRSARVRLGVAGLRNAWLSFRRWYQAPCRRASATARSGPARS